MPPVEPLDYRLVACLVVVVRFTSQRAKLVKGAFAGYEDGIHGVVDKVNPDGAIRVKLHVPPRRWWEYSSDPFLFWFEAEDLEFLHKE
jgi:hypothetical protein